MQLKIFLIFCSVALVAAVYSQSLGLKLKTFSHADRDITLGGASSDGVLSRAGRGGFFFSRANLQLPSFGRAGPELPLKICGALEKPNLSRAGLFLSRGPRPG